MTVSLLADEHLIGTLRLELAFSDQVRTDQALPDADRLASEVIVPVLEEVAREYEGVDISLNRLEIDLGFVTEEELPSALKWALRNELDRRRPFGFRPFRPDEDLGINVILDGPVPSPAFSDGIVSSPVDQLLAYLSAHAIPWDEDVRTFDPVALFERAIETLAGGEAPAVAAPEVTAATLAPVAMTTSASASSPAAPPVSNPALVSFVSRLLPLQALRLAELARRSDRFPEVLELVDPQGIALDEILPPGVPAPGRMNANLSARMAAREAAWGAYRVGRRTLKVSADAPDERLGPSRNHPSVPSETSPVTELESPDFPEVMVTISFDEDRLEKEAATVDSGASNLSEDRPERAPSMDIPAKTALPDTPEVPTHHHSRSPSEEVAESASVPPSETVWEPMEEEMEAVPERITISDAGLVLIHPFIRRFLQNVGLVDLKGYFVSGEARTHAVHLLRHVTGYDDPHLGHRLSLEKVLCGLPVDYLVPEEWEATPEEEEEIEGMLKALLSHWPTLRKASIGALRSAFLQRPGEIAVVDGSFVVRVEGSTLDILMQDLPWENSIILLSWLDKPILVEWQK